MISEVCYRALCILRDNPGIPAGMFGHKLWPGNPAWKRMSNVGNGSAAGVGMSRGAGCYLGKLRRQGFIEQDRTSIPRSWIKEEGIRAIAEYEAAHPSVRSHPESSE
jgi:hypothetical protein